jgi:hypothetical protein
MRAAVVHWDGTTRTEAQILDYVPDSIRTPEMLNPSSR